MTGESRVAWREGLFLRPQHFQQQDRFTESLVRSRTEALRPYAWGVSALRLDDTLSAVGKFGVSACSGALPDGAPFSLPGDAPPPPLDVPGDARDAVIFLTLPAGRTARWSSPSGAVRPTPPSPDSWSTRRRCSTPSPPSATPSPSSWRGPTCATA